MMIIALLLYHLITAISAEYSVILTASGYIKGKLVTDEDVSYYTYLGIPYAEKPIGNLRFMPPVPKTPWLEELDATKVGAVCPQTEGYYTREQMSEDCLFLNIYVPANRTGSLPVLVYVHGGEFKSLSGDAEVIYDPRLLLQHDIVFVMMNYRLGALGFLSLDMEDASGNAGIKDIILALKWIKQNIGRFGGDPNRITLGGNSAGGVLAHYIMLSKKSTGLFQRSILISGSALGYRFLARHAKDNALALSQELNIESSNTTEILRKLKEVDAFDIVDAQESLGKNDSRSGFRPFAPFVPCIERESPTAVITQNPIEILKGGLPQNVPILAGFNAEEGIKMLPAISSEPRTVDELNANFELCIPSNIEYPYGSNDSQELANAIRQFYFNGDIINNGTLKNFVDLVSDTQFTYAIDSWIKLHKEKKSSKKLFYYVFSFDGELNFLKVSNNIDFPGTGHADELGYLFVTKATKSKLKNLDSRSRRMLDIMLTLFTNFVKYGNPTPEKYQEINWLECDRQHSHLLLNDHPQFKNGAPIPHRLAFWYQVYDQYYQYLADDGIIEKKVVP